MITESKTSMKQQIREPICIKRAAFIEEIWQKNKGYKYKKNSFC